MVKMRWGGGGAQLSPLSPLPLPSEFCNDEDNSVKRSAMDGWKKSIKSYPPNCDSSLFIFIFQFDLGRTSYFYI
jgi:hypothetical protein